MLHEKVNQPLNHLMYLKYNYYKYPTLHMHESFFHVIKFIFCESSTNLVLCFGEIISFSKLVLSDFKFKKKIKSQTF